MTRSSHLALRRGRGLRGVMLLPTAKGYRTRRERFDAIVLNVVKELGWLSPHMRTIEFCVEEVPPSPPASWESHGVVLARVFPSDKAARLGVRLVLYRRPILARCATVADIYSLVRHVIIENAATGLNILPQDIDPNY